MTKTHWYRIGDRHLGIRLWTPAVRWTWPVLSAEVPGYGIGQETTSIGYGPMERRWPRWSEHRHDPLARVHQQQVDRERERAAR